MPVWLDPARLAAYRLTTQGVEDAIRRSNLEVPGGRIESQQREFSVTSQTDLLRPAQFGDIPIKNVNGFPVKIRDVARVQEAAADERSAVRLNGREAISAGVIRQATVNPLRLSDGVRAMLPKLQADLPAGMTIDVANDNSVLIDRSVKNVYRTIVEAVALVALVALVIFVFLRTFRASIIPIVTIPVSLVGTFALMALAGFSVNTLTLSTLVKVRENVSPHELNHFGQRRSVSITANLSPDYSLGEALTFLNQTAAKVLKPGYTTDLNGTSREFRNSQGALGIVFVLALVFIFLVLAARRGRSGQP